MNREREKAPPNQRRTITLPPVNIAIAFPYLLKRENNKIPILLGVCRISCLLFQARREKHNIFTMLEEKIPTRNILPGKASGNVEESEALRTVAGVENWCSHCEKQYGGYSEN